MSRPWKGKDVFAGGTYDGVETRFTPRTLLEAIDDAAHEIDYSNFTTDKLERAQEIIRRYCEEHNIPLGVSRAQREVFERRRAAAHARAIERAAGDVDKLFKVIDKFAY